MKNKYLLLISSLLLGLAACSSDNPPTATKLSQNVQAVPPFTPVSVIADNDFEIPKNGENVLKLGTFHVVDNVYDPNGNKILIRRNAVVTGVYSNNGTDCEIAWKTIYANRSAYRKKHGTTTLGEVSTKSICDPQHGIEAGERVVIRFKSNIAE